MTRKLGIIGLATVISVIVACSVETAPTPVPLPLPYSGPFELDVVPEPSPPREVTSPFALPSAGFIPLSFVANRSLGQLGELDVFEMQGRVYAAQRRSPSGFALIDVTEPVQPSFLGTWKVSPPTTGEHIKVFRQGDRWYLALPLEVHAPSIACGLAIVEITDPMSPILRGVHNGVTTGAQANWCGVHSVRVVTNKDGNAEYLLATSPDTWDLRVLDIRDSDKIRETNVYHLHVHPHSGRAWTHQIAVVGDRVYVSTYDGGVMILDKDALLAGGSSDDVELTAPGSIAAPNFRPHDAYPSANGDFLFVNDAFLSDGGLRLFDIRDLANPRSVMTIDPEALSSQRHTLLVQDDLLIVPWRTNGVRVYRYDFSNADNPILVPAAFQEVREQPRGTGDGIAAVESHPCLVDGATRTCVYASDATRGLIILALDDA